MNRRELVQRKRNAIKAKEADAGAVKRVEKQVRVDPLPGWLAALLKRNQELGLQN